MKVKISLLPILLIIVLLGTIVPAFSQETEKTDCGGAGYFEKDEENDIWPSTTGCYIPEERFSRDDILAPNLYCVHKIRLKEIYGEEFRLEYLKEGSPYLNIQCFHDDYIDDLDDFCKGYVREDHHNLFKDGEFSWEVQESYHKNPWAWDDGKSCYSQFKDPAAKSRRFGDTTWGNIDTSGIKSKYKQCLKIYIEEYAHRGDSGEIVLNGARDDVGLGHCQWVAKHGTGSSFGTLRNERFDAENFATRGWVANGGAGSDIGKLRVRPGDGMEFDPGLPPEHPLSGLDFSKRDCPTIEYPDNQWDVNLEKHPHDPYKCSAKMGADRINDPRNLEYADVHLTTRLSDPFSAYWSLRTGGSEGVPVISPPSPPPPPEKDKDGKPEFPWKSYKESRSNIIRSEPEWGWWPLPGGNPGWVDYSWPARTCHHYGAYEGCAEYKDPHDPDSECIRKEYYYNVDYHRENPDYSSQRDGDEHGKLITPPIGGSWKLNQKQRPMWCEFEVPFNPYVSSESENNKFIYPSNSKEKPSPQAAAHKRINSPKGGSLNLSFHMVERIRDGCGAFTMRKKYDGDPHANLAKFMVGGDAISRCENWKGFLGKEYNNPDILTWRLPRFDYEFLKAFLQCTGPVIEIKAEKLSGGKCKTGDSKDAVCSNWHPASYSEEEGCKLLPPEGRPSLARPVALPSDGFWCTCPGDKEETQNCNENYCTCDQKVTHDKDGNPITVCKDYGPFKRWLQCFYQARAKACPVLTRDISTGIAPSTALVKKIKTPVSPEGVCIAEEETFDMSPEDEPEYTHMRWSAEEPNILATLPISIESAGGGKKSDDLVIKSTEAPYLEPVIPYPLTNMVEQYSSEAENLGITVANDEGIRNLQRSQYQKALSKESEFFADTSKNTPRGTEAIVGPRGCDIGGWYEMMLYQARCIKLFKLNCLCDYNKTFIEGSAESYVLKRGGMSFPTKTAYIQPAKEEKPAQWREMKTATGKTEQVLIPAQPAKPRKIAFKENNLILPLMWRGHIGPDYAEDSVNAARLWEKENYQGLNEAEAGDFIIYDESITDSSGADARYRRHIAFVESTSKDDNGIPHKITITEWNWGKNQDSCGNTDRWKTRTSRNIFREEENAPHPGGVVGNVKYATCDDPDMKNCYEPNWNRIKIYRPKLDVVAENDEHPVRPICTKVADNFPERITHQKLDALGIPPTEHLKDMPLESVIATGGWKRLAVGYYDNSEVEEFMEEWVGQCEPPVDLRISNVERRRLQNLSLSAPVSCDNQEITEGGVIIKKCPKEDNSDYYTSPGDAGLVTPVYPPED